MNTGALKYLVYIPIFGLACSLLIIVPAYTQNTDSSIEGIVYDYKTKKAMAGANVYLSQTILGDVSDDEGFFRIENIPVGSYELVISFVGYELYNTKVHIGEREEFFIEQYLSPREESLGELTVRSERDKRWERDLNRFEKFFIGETGNGAQTEIQNPEVLRFDTDMSTLIATTERDLLILNKALGYEIVVDLMFFEWSYLNDSGSTLYFYRFKELEPTSERELNRWQENRQQTYKYSKERFLRSLISKENEGQYETSGGSIKPVIQSKENTYNLFDDTNQIYRFKVGIGGLDNNVTVKIDDWRVMNDTKYGYIGYNESQERTEKEMLIDSNGSLQNPLDFTFDGIWYKHRLADKLPLNFRD